MSSEEQAKPFDEAAALAELERLRESIQAARQARQRTSDEFAAFIKSFRNPTSTPSSADATMPARASEARQQAPDPLPDPEPPAVAVPSGLDSGAEPVTLPVSQIPHRYRIGIRSVGILAIIAVIALALVSSRGRRASPPTTVAVSESAASARNAAAPRPRPASQSAPATPTTHAIAVELQVIRPVWMRVVVDGRKDVEGTVQAGPMHLSGDQSIVVRVGNGGDVLVRTGSRDEPFGETAQPRTRTFPKP